MTSGAPRNRRAVVVEEDRVERQRRGDLSETTIVAAAIRLADSEGLDKVSIRRIASELDARAMSLYDHFASKQDLLASMVDEVGGEVLIPGSVPEDWREALATIARRMYAMMVAHPWVVAVTMHAPRFGANSAQLARQMAKATASLNLDSEAVWSIQGSVNDYVLGHSLRATSAPRSEDLEEAISPDQIAAVPELAALPGYLLTRAAVERFEFGLGLVLDGVEQYVSNTGP